MLEVLPKKRFLGHKWGGGWPLEQNDTLGIQWPPKHVLQSIERQAAFYGLLCTASQGTKKKDATWQLHPYAHPKVVCLNFGMWGRVVDIINHAKF